ncbi:type-2 ice-structuring protein-like [Paralichthys olivaceus]|uniref:type-2 ice-structuring protein-like n=1 Tax=Paralichthys olivaceus TaxID=8255 RepID=UPI0037505CC9
MKTLALSVLLFAAMALTGADATRHEDCPASWTRIHGRCFLYVPAQTNWATAEKNCQSMNANLATVHGWNELRRIQIFITKASRGLGRTWLGGPVCQSEGLSLWCDGTSLNYRHCGSLNYHWNQNCMFTYNGGRKCWDDEMCTNKYSSVCAKDI